MKELVSNGRYFTETLYSNRHGFMVVNVCSFEEAVHDEDYLLLILEAALGGWDSP